MPDALMEEKGTAALTLELPPEVYHRLREVAERLGQSPQVMVQEWLIERLVPPTPATDSEREKVRQALRAAGLLVELSPTLRERIDPTVRQEDVEASLARAGGKPLSEIVLEQRGPK